MKKYLFSKDFWIIIFLSAISLCLGTIFKNLGSAIFAIMFGLICAQFIKNKNSKIVNTTLKKSLNTTIILLGFGIHFNLILNLGFKTLSLILVTLISVIVGFYYLAKLFKFNSKFAILFAIGNAICGSSAIMSANNYIKSKKEDFNLSVSIVNLMGVILMFSFPLIFKLIPHNITQNGFIIGSTIQSVAQVIGASEIANHQYLLVATLVKMARVFMMIFVLIGLGIYTKKQNTSTNTTLISNIKSVIPLFLILFIGSVALTNIVVLPEILLKIIKEISHVLETIALVSIGYQIMLIDLAQQFKKIILLIICSLVIQILLAQILVLFI